ncbi:MAG: hypothetical protein HRU34_01440 [Richelia sp.]|nr:hypothetical protein [Richelia sp.]
MAISRLETIITTTTNKTLQQQAAESLIAISPKNSIALETLPQKPKSNQKPKNRKTKGNKQENTGRIIEALVEGIAASKNDESKRPRASTLAKFAPGNPIAFHTLLHLVKSASSNSVRKHTVEDLNKIMIDEQIADAVAFFQQDFSHQITEAEMEEFRHCYKLFWGVA